MPTVNAYIRVSTDRQEHESQRQQINAWASATESPIAGWWTDKESGAVRWQDRQLAALLAASEPGDSIIVSEISRIARSTIGVLSFLQEAAERSIIVHAVQNRITLDGSLHSKITVTVLALAAEIERDLCRARTKAAMQARREKGLPVGRAPGSRVRGKLDQRRDEINRLLALRVSKAAIARVLGVSRQAFYNWIAKPPIHTTDTRTLPLPGIEPAPPAITIAHPQRRAPVALDDLSTKAPA